MPPAVPIRSREVLLITATVTLILYLVPHGRYVAYPLLLISTLVHELGHGVTALLVGGSFHRLELWPDGSGAAHWSGRVGSVRQALVAAGGLVGPAIAAAIGFAVGRSVNGARLLWYGLAGGLGLALLLVVRNWFGFVFVTLLAALAAVIAAKAKGDWARLLLVFFSVQLALSVFSRADYLFTSRRPHRPRPHALRRGPDRRGPDRPLLALGRPLRRGVARRPGLWRDGRLAPARPIP